MPKFFTLLEAEEQLPQVERLLKAVARFKEERDEADMEFTRLKHKIAFSGGMIAPRDEIIELRRDKETASQRLKDTFNAIQGIGCQVKDLETGLVDFPTLYRGQEVYLCWKLGETGITFWHYVEDGFRGRKAIDSEFLSNHRGDAQ